MTPTNSQGIYTKPPVEITTSPVIKMNSSERIIPQPVPAFYQRLLRTIPNRATKLINFLPLEKKQARIFKRAADILIAIFVVVSILSWMIPLLAFLIILDSKGPVFFLQKRSGRGGKLFSCIKLRTMHVNTESDLRPASANDERITRSGKFLRKHYLDELPQFFNVLIGDMSVIGPRPHMISDNLKYEDVVGHYDFRNKVKPGITGLAQVLGFAGPIDDLQKMKDRVQLDTFYIRHWSLKIDLVILYRTLLKIIGF